MKNILMIFVCCAFLAACGGATQNDANTNTGTETENTETSTGNDTVKAEGDNTRIQNPD